MARIFKISWDPFDTGIRGDRLAEVVRTYMPSKHPGKAVLKWMLTFPRATIREEAHSANAGRPRS